MALLQDLMKDEDNCGACGTGCDANLWCCGADFCQVRSSPCSCACPLGS